MDINAAAAPSHAHTEKESDLQTFGKGWRYIRPGPPKEPPLYLLGGEWLGDGITTKQPTGGTPSPSLGGELFRPAPQGLLTVGNAEGAGTDAKAEKFRLMRPTGPAGNAPALAFAAPQKVQGPEIERIVCEAMWAEPVSGAGPVALPKNEGDLLKVKLVEIRGTVLVTIKGQKRRMFEGMEVATDSVVRTGEGSSVVLVLGRGVSARLLSNTEVSLAAPTFKDKTPSLNLQMKRGTVFQKIAPRLVPEAAKSEARAGRVLTEMGSVLCKGGDFAAVYEDGRFFVYVLRGKIVTIEKTKGAEALMEPRAAGVPGMSGIPVVGEEVLTTVLLRAVAEAGSFNTKVNALLSKLGRSETLPATENEYLRKCPKLAVGIPVVSSGGTSGRTGKSNSSADAEAPGNGSTGMTVPSPGTQPGWQEATEAMGAWDMLLHKSR